MGACKWRELRIPGIVTQPQQISTGMKESAGKDDATEENEYQSNHGIAAFHQSPHERSNRITVVRTLITKSLLIR
jgi:hypothetical protein